MTQFFKIILFFSMCTNIAHGFSFDEASLDISRQCKVIESNWENKVSGKIDLGAGVQNLSNGGLNLKRLITLSAPIKFINHDGKIKGFWDYEPGSRRADLDFIDPNLNLVSFVYVQGDQHISREDNGNTIVVTQPGRSMLTFLDREFKTVRVHYVPHERHFKDFNLSSVTVPYFVMDCL
jgi:hypothetical protein